MKLKCFFGIHNWTTANQENIPPTQEQMDAGDAGFKDYCKVYCKDCGDPQRELPSITQVRD